MIHIYIYLSCSRNLENCVFSPIIIGLLGNILHWLYCIIVTLFYSIYISLNAEFHFQEFKLQQCKRWQCQGHCNLSCLAVCIPMETEIHSVQRVCGPHQRQSRGLTSLYEKNMEIMCLSDIQFWINLVWKLRFWYDTNVLLKREVSLLWRLTDMKFLLC